MKDTGRCTSPGEIAGHRIAPLDLDIGSHRIRLCTVAELERLVDRGALLRGEVDPPYWAYLWSGAPLLACYLERFHDLGGRRVLELGCGLALPGITAAVLGADVTLVDLDPAALAFAAASAAANGVCCTTLAADFLQLDLEPRYDLVVAAEVAYDRERFSELAGVLTRHLEPGGSALIADGYRTDTRELYRALAARGCPAHAIDVRVVEEGRPMAIRLSVITAVSNRITPRGTAPPPA